MEGRKLSTDKCYPIIFIYPRRIKGEENPRRGREEKLALPRLAMTHTGKPASKAHAAKAHIQ